MLAPGSPQSQIEHFGGQLPYLNPAAFSLPPVPGSPFGNAGRNIARGPGFNQLDLAANKKFRLPFEGSYLQFRTEFFNIFNHSNFVPPPSNFSSGAFGKITATYDPRLIQFGVKLGF